MRLPESNRRQFLAGAATAAALGIAGCSGEADDGSDTTSDAESDPTDDDGDTTNDAESDPTDDESDSTNDTEPEETEEEGALETSYRSRERYAYPGESFDDFEDVTKWTALSGQLTEGSESFTGSRSARLVGEDGSSVLIERAVDSRDLSNTELSMAIRTTTPDSIAVNVRLIDAFGNQLIRSLRRISQSDEDVGWFRTAPGTFSSSGEVFDITQIERVQVNMLNATDTEATMHVDDMRTHPKPDSGYIVLSWDDSRQSYYDEGAPINDQFGFSASIATAPRLVGGGNFMSVGQLKERQEAGDDIVTHGSVSLSYDEMAEEELSKTIRQNKKWLINQGFSGADTIVYPGNNYDATTLSAASEYHYLGGMNQSGSLNTTGVHSFDPLVLPRTIGNDLSIARRIVDNVAKYNECGILNFHDFDLGNTMDADEYEELLRYIDNKGDAVEVVTFDELWELRKQAEHAEPTA